MVLEVVEVEVLEVEVEVLVEVELLVLVELEELVVVVVEELEAWFLGDMEAVRRAYSRIPASLLNTPRLRNPDSVIGGTWETLEKTLQRHGYFKGGYPKVEAARTISTHMDINRNRSKSFQVFRDGLLALF